MAQDRRTLIPADYDLPPGEGLPPNRPRASAMAMVGLGVLLVVAIGVGVVGGASATGLSMTWFGGDEPEPIAELVDTAAPEEVAVEQPEPTPEPVPHPARPKPAPKKIKIKNPFKKKDKR